MNEQMRKEFEVFAKSEGWDISHNGEHYNHIYAYYAWLGWQSSRESIVVDLSDLCEASYTYFGTCYKSDVEYRLEQAGVSYK